MATQNNKAYVPKSRVVMVKACVESRLIKEGTKHTCHQINRHEQGQDELPTMVVNYLRSKCTFRTCTWTYDTHTYF